MAETNPSARSSKHHALMVPLPVQGHIKPSQNLAHTLASSHNFTITFITTHFIHQQLSQAHPNPDSHDIFASARASSGLDIRDLSITDSFPLGFDRVANQEQFWEGMLHVFPAHIEQLVEELVKSSSPRPTCLILDTFYNWGSKIANKFGLLHISFWTQSALSFALFYHWKLLRENGHFGARENRTDAIDYIPGVREIKAKDLISYFQMSDTDTVAHRTCFSAFEDVRNADFILANTVEQLEPETISSLKSSLDCFYPIGPVSAPSSCRGRASSSLWAESDCSKWLDTKPKGSVLYASFGSYARVTRHDFTEIAYGLKESKMHFIWVVRDDVVGAHEVDFLPSEFKEMIKDQGLIVSWCKQTEVLSHPAIGGFLTHCGWNSVLESISSGVPFLCFPIMSDQPVNRKLVVDEWGIGVNLCDEAEVTREEVATKVAGLITGELGNELRVKIQRYKKLMENESSHLNLGPFIRDLTSVRGSG